MEVTAHMVRAVVRAARPWENAVADALARVPRPIPVEAILLPRDAAELGNMPRYDRSTFPPARPAATLVLLYPGDGGELHLPLTVRQTALRDHAGEVSLPGGSVEPGDSGLPAAALREGAEEVGLDPTDVLVHGSLDQIWIPVSNFELRPIVATLPSRPALVARTAEVAAIIELPVGHLLSDEALVEELIELRGLSLRARVYRYGGERIWGATARTLVMLAAVLRLVDPPLLRVPPDP
jgi:8-oxo-dGTP pyrophosphatase MutT (NUDIX family)